MPYRWTPTSILDDNILDVDDVNRCYQAAKEVLNGGLDRDNLPVDSVTPALIADKAVLEMTIDNNIELASLTQDTYAYPSARANSISGAVYGDDIIGGGGGWNLLNSKSFDTDEGMLSISFKCWVHLPKYAAFYIPQSTDRAAKKCVSFQIRYNGSVVAESGEYYGTFENIHLDCTIPVAKSPGQVDVYFKVPFQQNEPETMVVLCLGGGQVVTKNRKR